MIDVLLFNGYPLDFIFSTINSRIKTLSKRKDLYTNTIKNINNPNNNNPTNYFTIPYMHEVSENFKPVVEKNNFKVTYKPMNTLKSVIRLGK